MKAAEPKSDNDTIASLRIENKRLRLLVRRAILKGLDIGAYAEDVTDAEQKADKWLSKFLYNGK